ncbi:phosphoglucomutase/phosphomannomutase family protein [Brevibacillus migulae]|uniref:phosphoglucomutase/phosphomannomutase family protein n=1 Tax=Brevibacillus migulae TaxID=1644114 RepID=UPI00106EE4EB|nr:phosphoglucomutase/phosphomannomutase family protein [Brevibacillus migulae]
MLAKRLAFGTDGWRAVMADEFTVENVRIVAQAIALYTIEKGMAEQGIIVGHDTRFLGRRFAEEVVRVLAANGIRADLVNEATPTPVVAFGVKHFGTSGAVMITASHNPPEYNGLKYIPDYAGPATPEITDRLEELIGNVQEQGGVHAIDLEQAAAAQLMQYIFLRPHYEAHIRRLIHFERLRKANLHVVVDAMHGAGIGYVSSILSEAGVKTTTLRDYEDPLFGGSLPEPGEKHLMQLSKEVVMQQADLGLANDGDADRFGVIDEKGKYVPANQVLLLLAHHLIKNRGLKGRIVRTVATTHRLDRIAQRHGLEALETPVGFKYIGEEMRKGDVLLGGEESGGASIIGHIPEKDGILINLLLAEMVAWEGRPITEILEEAYREYGELHTTRIDIRHREKERWLNDFLSMTHRKAGSFPVVSIDRKDGVKLQLQGGHWLLIRPSGTEPLLRIYCEAATAQALEQLKEVVEDWFCE